MDYNEQLLRDYRSDGYADLRAFVSNNKLKELQNHLTRFIEEVVPKMPPEHVFYEDMNDASTLKQLQQMALHDAWFEECFHNGTFRALAERLLRKCMCLPTAWARR